MKYEYGICGSCNRARNVLISSNPFAKQVCGECIVNNLDTESASDIRKLSLTLQVPFDLKNYYTTLLAVPDKVEAMETYLRHLANGKKLENHSFFDWHEIDNHYHAAKAFTHVLAEITPLKKLLMQRSEEKWGAGYSFQEYVKLENIYENTVKQFGIDSAIQQDAIRKASKVSVKIDSLIESGDYKEVKDATSAYSSFLKAANIDELVAVSNDDTVRTVADLVLFLEQKGWRFNELLPEVEKDEIDYLMDNYMDNVKAVVTGATGLSQQLSDLMDKQREDIEAKSLGEIAQTYILEDDIDNAYHDHEDMKFENEMKSELMRDEDWNEFNY